MIDPVGATQYPDIGKVGPYNGGNADTGFDMESACPRCETCTRIWNIDFIQL